MPKKNRVGDTIWSPLDSLTPSVGIVDGVHSNNRPMYPPSLNNNMSLPEACHYICLPCARKGSDFLKNCNVEIMIRNVCITFKIDQKAKFSVSVLNSLS